MISEFLTPFEARQVGWERGRLYALEPARAVLHLDCERRPAAVLRPVISIGIDPVERESSRTRSHITQEGRERRQPFRADRNAAASIAIVSVIRGIQAASLHRAPCAILPSRRRAVSRAYIADDLALKASATTARAVSKMWAVYNGLPPAIAPTVPERLPMPGANYSSKYNPTGEAATGEILKGRH